MIIGSSRKTGRFSQKTNKNAHLDDEKETPENSHH
jgi:hypothetical protein